VKAKDLIVKFDSVCLRDKYGINTLTGTITASSVLKLLDSADLKANPRDPKTGKITDDIIESLKGSPELFPFKSKGMLISAGACEPLERNRFRLDFDDEDFEGILDGGHNALALAMHIISEAGGDEAKKALRKVQRWEDMKTVWLDFRDRIEEVKDVFDFFVPVEILFPQDTDEGRQSFEDSILEIAQARNNNAELTRETKAHKKGLFDPIKESLDPALLPQIEWKTNDGGRIKARDIVALALIPLSKLPNAQELPGLKDFRPVSLYRYKGGCVKNYNDFMEHVTIRTKGDMRSLEDKAITSALARLRELPALFDQIYLEMPEAYNKVSPGFGRISAIRMYEAEKIGTDPKKYLRTAPRSKYYQREAVYEVPEGFVLPIVWGLNELMEVRSGKVEWATDPAEFLRDHLQAIMVVYHGVMSLSRFDPQNVDNVPASYELAASQIRALMMSRKR
jgi:hypothetical protein